MVDVPEMNFLMVDGHGNPNTSERFQFGVETLFGLSFAIKFMIKKGDLQVDYGVMPLEGLWWTDDMAAFSVEQKGDWKWTLMIMQPDMVTEDLVAEAREQVRQKKKSDVVDEIRFEAHKEGRAAQIMHIGPFEEEGPTIETLHRFIEDSGHSLSGRHHEIYLSDIRRAAPEKWRTIIRQSFSIAQN
jgi:hypothetical protein